MKGCIDLMDAIDAIVWEADGVTFQLTFVSKHAQRLLGYAPERWLAEPTFWIDHIHAEDRDATIASCRAAAAEKRRTDFECRMLASDGRFVWLRALVHGVTEAEHPVALRGVMFDITDRKRAERELEELASRVILGHEEQRRRIGRELHDHISQMLAVLTIQIDQLRADGGTPPPVASALAKLREQTAEVTNDIHDLSRQLHSSALEYLGLLPALHRLIAEFSMRHEIPIELTHASIPEALPPDVALCLFRVTEESLTNIARHSRAKSGRVHLHGRSDGLSLTVEDAGEGFNLANLEPGAGLGFASMRAHLRVLGGTVRIDSAPSRGTRIDVWVPQATLVRKAVDEGDDVDATGQTSSRVKSA